MAYYKIEFKPKAEKELRKLPAAVIGKISAEIDQLAENPYPPGCKKLIGSEHAYRIRVGDYRVVYTVLNNRLIVQIIKIGHRKDVYN